jgi:hypothetical protein
MILGQGLRLGLLGLAAGIGLAVVLGRLLQTLLYEANSLSEAARRTTPPVTIGTIKPVFESNSSACWT